MGRGRSSGVVAATALVCLLAMAVPAQAATLTVSGVGHWDPAWGSLQTATIRVDPERWLTSAFGGHNHPLSGLTLHLDPTTIAPGAVVDFAPFLVEASGAHDHTFGLGSVYSTSGRLWITLGDVAAESVADHAQSINLGALTVLGTATDPYIRLSGGATSYEPSHDHLLDVPERTRTLPGWYWQQQNYTSADGYFDPGPVQSW